MVRILGRAQRINLLCTLRFKSIFQYGLAYQVSLLPAVSARGIEMRSVAATCSSVNIPRACAIAICHCCRSKRSQRP